MFFLGFMFFFSSRSSIRHCWIFFGKDYRVLLDQFKVLTVGPLKLSPSTSNLFLSIASRLRDWSSFYSQHPCNIRPAINIHRRWTDWRFFHSPIETEPYFLFLSFLWSTNSDESLCSLSKFQFDHYVVRWAIKNTCGCAIRPSDVKALQKRGKPLVSRDVWRPTIYRHRSQ